MTESVSEETDAMPAPAARSPRLEFREYAERKAGKRIDINNILAAMSVTTLSLLVGLKTTALNQWAVAQLAVSIPLLVTSSLAYSKLSYRREVEARYWDTLGWLTHALGYLAILNTVILMLLSSSYELGGYLLLGVAALFFLVDTVIDIHLWSGRRLEKLVKCGMALALLVLGGLLPHWW